MCLGRAKQDSRVAADLATQQGVACCRDHFWRLLDGPAGVSSFQHISQQIAQTAAEFQYVMSLDAARLPVAARRAIARQMAPCWQSDRGSDFCTVFQITFCARWASLLSCLRENIQQVAGVFDDEIGCDVAANVAIQVSVAAVNLRKHEIVVGNVYAGWWQIRWLLPDQSWRLLCIGVGFRCPA